MSTRSNSQSLARRRAGRQLAEIIKEYGLNLRKISKDTGVDIITLSNLATFTPHLTTIEKIADYLEKIACSMAGAEQESIE